MAITSYRYWVGGAGTWTDAAHWSDTSGGAGGFSIPAAGTLAVFDGNSFTADGETVTWVNTVASTLAGIRALDVNRQVTLALSNSGRNGKFTITDELSSSESVTFTGSGFNAAPVAGAEFVADVRGSSAPTLQAQATATPMPTFKLYHDYPNGILGSGVVFDFSGFDVGTADTTTGGTFGTATAGVATTVKMSGTAFSTNGFSIVGNLVTLEYDANTTLYLKNNVTCNGKTLPAIEITGSGAFSPQDSLYVERLTCTQAGKSIGSTVSWTVLGKLTLTGAPGSEIVVDAAVASPDQIQISAGTVDLRYVNFAQIMAAGAAAPFTAYDSIDSGLNTDINFLEYPVAPPGLPGMATLFVLGGV